MPIYAYRCAACGHARDVLQKIADAPLTVCPVCGAAEFTKQLTAPGFHLKGSGWYATDFKGSGKAVDKRADGNADKATDAGSDKSEPSAPAGTGDGKSVAASGGCGASCACH